MTPKTKEEIAALRKAFILGRCSQSSLNADTLYFYEEAIRLAESRYPLPPEEPDEREYRIYTNGDVRYRYAGSVLECQYKGGAWQSVIAIEARDILTLAALIAHPFVEKKAKTLRVIRHNNEYYRFNPVLLKYEILRRRVDAGQPALSEGVWEESIDFHPEHADSSLAAARERVDYCASLMAVYNLKDAPYEETE